MTPAPPAARNLCRKAAPAAAARALAILALLAALAAGCPRQEPAELAAPAAAPPRELRLAGNPDTRLLSWTVSGGGALRALVAAPGASGASAAPGAALVLFVGGNGKLGLTDTGEVTGLGQNFLARSADLFQQQGLAMALIDRPTNVGDDASGDYRLSDAQARDAALVCAYLRARWHVPVVFVGTSRGSISAASATALLGPQGPDAVVLTSSVMRHSKRGASTVFSAALGDIAVPALVVHNREDACPLCPADDAPRLRGALTRAPRGELILLSGGGGMDDPCGALSTHGYNGIERDAVNAISAWILDPSRGPDRPNQ